MADFFDQPPSLTTYKHATRLYLGGGARYQHIPKFGHMYCVHFTINQKIIDAQQYLDSEWARKYLALLVQEVQLPKFKITTDTLNQYNRKTNVQTKIAYEPMSFTFHDDVSDEVNSFWLNYYKYFYQDSRYSDPNSPNIKAAYGDTKYGTLDYPYGYNPAQPGANQASQQYFLDSIEIFLLSGGRYTKIKIINPMITNWDHDSLSQEGTKILKNKMSVVYEDVVYSSGRLAAPASGDDFVTLFEDEAVYDKTVSPLPASSPQTAIPPTFSYYKTDNAQNVNQPMPTGGTRGGLSGQSGPIVSQQAKNGLTIGQIISDINLIKTFAKNPRQAWNVYGFNVKQTLIGGAIGAITANPANVVGGGVIPQQGTLSTNKFTPGGQ